MDYSTDFFRHMRFIIGRNIHHYRVRKKMPLSKLARLSGVSEPLLDYYELGKGEFRLREMLQIACALNVTMVDMLQE